MVQLLDLPDSILLDLLDRVQWSSRAVCAKLRDLMDSYRTDVRLRVPLEEGDHAWRFWRLLSKLPRITSLDCRVRWDASYIYYCWWWWVRDELAPFGCFKNLSTLTLQSASIQLLPSFPNVHTLVVDGCERLKDITPVLSCPRLTSLDLRNCMVTDLQPLTACVNLNSLHVNMCPDLRDIAAITACINLTSLRLSCCPSVQSLDPVARCQKLTHFEAVECYQVSSIAGIAACTGLRSLFLGGLKHGFANVLPLAACTTLTSLHFDTSRRLVRPLSPHIAFDLCSRLPLLQRLSWSGINVESSEFPQVTVQLPGLAVLKYFKLWRCPYIVGLNLSMCEQLETVEAENCGVLSSLVVRGCGRLRQLRLDGCPSLESADVEGCHELTELDVTGCPQLPLRGLAGAVGAAVLPES